MHNWKVPGHNFLLVDPVKIDGRIEPVILEFFHDILVDVYDRQEVSQDWQGTNITVLYKESD